jgi:hypothetical protein
MLNSNHSEQYLKEIFSLGFATTKDLIAQGKVQDTEEVNSLGYRGPEFSSNNDLVVAGCSHSYGVGIPEEYTWGSLVANHLGRPYSNLSYWGKSTSWIITNLMAYMQGYGNPKTLLCLFPDFYRLRLPVNEEILTADKNEHDGGIAAKTGIYDAYLHNKGDLSARPKYSKAPYVAEDVLPLELPFYLAMQSIKMLTWYCRSNDIELLWSTWDPDTHDYLLSVKDSYGYGEFIDLSINDWEPRRAPDYSYLHKDRCHSLTASTHGDVFDIGQDSPGDPQYSHWGSHVHIHMAQSYIENIRESSDARR